MDYGAVYRLRRYQSQIVSYDRRRFTSVVRFEKCIGIQVSFLSLSIYIYINDSINQQNTTYTQGFRIPKSVHKLKRT